MACYTTPVIYQHRLEVYRRMRASYLRCIAAERAEGYKVGPRQMQRELASLRRSYYGSRAIPMYCD